MAAWSDSAARPLMVAIPVYTWTQETQSLPLCAPHWLTRPAALQERQRPQATQWSHAACPVQPAHSFLCFTFTDWGSGTAGALPADQAVLHTACSSSPRQTAHSTHCLTLADDTHHSAGVAAPTRYTSGSSVAGLLPVLVHPPGAARQRSPPVRRVRRLSGRRQPARDTRCAAQAPPPGERAARLHTKHRHQVTMLYTFAGSIDSMLHGFAQSCADCARPLMLFGVGTSGLALPAQVPAVIVVQGPSCGVCARVLEASAKHSC